jgi:4,5-dihydroxyphthalate decarboxylase
MDIPATGPVTLRTNMADYPVTKAVKEGKVSSPLIRFDFCGPEVANEGFQDMIRRDAYDCGEMAIVTHSQIRIYGKPYVALPIPLVGKVHHESISYNSAKGELGPRDIEGKKVGVRSYTQTTGMWVRGVLQHDYGVDLDKVTWMTTEPSHLAEHVDPPNVKRLPEGRKIEAALMAGEIAASLGAAPKDPAIRPLIPDAREAGKKWSEKVGFIPINHLFVVHTDLTRKRPDVVRELFRVLAESRAMAPANVLAAMPPVGIEANRKGIETAIDWAFEQKILPRKIKVEDLFDEVTIGLGA